MHIISIRAFNNVLAKSSKTAQQNYHITIMHTNFICGSYKLKIFVIIFLNVHRKFCGFCLPGEWLLVMMSSQTSLMSGNCILAIMGESIYAETDLKAW